MIRATEEWIACPCERHAAVARELVAARSFEHEPTPAALAGMTAVLAACAAGAETAREAASHAGASARCAATILGTGHVRGEIQKVLVAWALCEG